MSSHHARVSFAASFIALALCASGAATAQSNASAELTDSLGCIAGPGSAIRVGSTNGGFTADIGSSGPGCIASAGGYSYAGVMGAYAHSAVAFENTSSGALRGDSSASWNDSVHVIWPSAAPVPGVSVLRVGFNVEAHGGVAATRSDAEGFNLAMGSAGIDYAFSFAGRASSGSKKVVAGEAPVIDGSFGSITGFVDLTPTGVVLGAYTFSDIDVSMTGHAFALVQNKFIGLGLHTASAQGDFGSTLQWKGITGVQAFDSEGIEVVLPSDFRLALIGGQNGFDYWNAAPMAAVPEPGIWISMLSGLGVLVGARRRHRAVSRGGQGALVPSCRGVVGQSCCVAPFASEGRVGARGRGDLVPLRDPPSAHSVPVG